MANFISATNLVWEYPRSLLYALATNHPDREVWLQSFWEVKDGIISMDTYETTTLAQYCAYREQALLM